jgi:hypothetical protein
VAGIRGANSHVQFFKEALWCYARRWLFRTVYKMNGLIVAGLALLGIVITQLWITHRGHTKRRLDLAEEVLATL